MLEHVGRGNYDLFLKNANSVLKDEGLMLLHYISSLKESSGNAWIKKYIFPGGTIPSLREIVDIMPNYNFHTLDIENLRPHYKLTLLHWLKNFRKNKSVISDKMGVRFARTWELYLASCAAAFNNGIVDLHQILFSKGVNNKIPINRAN
jgi:cyclopropane-fatty-acyl-phospholipid synthase